MRDFQEPVIKRGTQVGSMTVVKITHTGVLVKTKTGNEVELKREDIEFYMNS